MTINGDARDPGANAADLPETENAASAENATPQNEAVAALEAEKADLKDRLMRALADVENTRRRAERETKDAKAYAITGFARDMLNVADNIRRAIESGQQADGPDNPAAKALLEGVELTERDLLATLGRHGVKRLEPEGQKFDPNFHQAMFEVPTEEVPNGTVVQVVQSGYAIGDRVLRPAMVGVSKGAVKTPPQPHAANES